MAVNFTIARNTQLVTDGDGDGKADAGDTLRTTVTVHNTGTTDATSVVFEDLLGVIDAGGCPRAVPRQHFAVDNLESIATKPR